MQLISLILNTQKDYVSILDALATILCICGENDIDDVNNTPR